MHSEQGSSTIVIDSSDSDTDDILENPQSSTTGVRNADHYEADHFDEGDNCPTPPGQRRARACMLEQLFISASIMLSGKESFLLSLQCQVMRIGK